MLRITLTAFMLPLLLLFRPADAPSQNAATNENPDSLSENGSGTLQKMIVASGNATMEMDLNRLNGASSRTEKLESTSSRMLIGVAFCSGAKLLLPSSCFQQCLARSCAGLHGIDPADQGRASRTIRCIAQPTGDRETCSGRTVRPRGAR